MGEIEYVRRSVSFHPEKDAELLLWINQQREGFSKLTKAALDFYRENRDAPPLDKFEAMIDRKLAGLALPPVEDVQETIISNDEITDDILDFE